MTNPDRQAEAREVLARHLPNDAYVGPYSRPFVIAAMLDFAALATTPTPAEEACPASPDHGDITETIANAADDWKAKGYTSALAEVRDMANVGRALMEALPEGYSYMDCPSEIVADLINERDEARTPNPSGGYADGEGREAIADVIAAEVSGPATQDFGIQQAHRLDQLAAADVILALLPSQERMREAATEMLTAFAEGVVWNDEKRAAYEALSASLDLHATSGEAK